jgi:hypothetical protein
MVNAQTISIIFAGLSIGLAAIYYMMTLRNSQKAQQLQLETRQAQMFMQLYDRFNQKEHQRTWTETIWRMDWDDYQDWYHKYGPETNPDGWSSMQSVHAFFEGIGVLVNRGLIDIKMVDDMMSSNIIITWEKFRPLIYQIREEWNVPQMWEWVEYLYDEIRNIMVAEHPELMDTDMFASVLSMKGRG